LRKVFLAAGSFSIKLIAEQPLTLSDSSRLIFTRDLHHSKEDTVKTSPDSNSVLVAFIPQSQDSNLFLEKNQV
jgi:hypothetical protein